MYIYDTATCFQIIYNTFLQKQQNMFVLCVIGLFGFLGEISSATWPEDVSIMKRFATALTSLTLDEDGNGTLVLSELGEALAACGIELPQYQVRELLTKLDTNNDGKLDMEEFGRIYTQLKRDKDVGITLKKKVPTRQDVQTHGCSANGITHIVKDSEPVAFSDWINSNLKDDPDLAHLLPIRIEKDELFKKVKDGVILCKLINYSVPDTIDERTINKKPGTIHHRVENHNLLLNSAQAIGCNVVNIGHVDLEEGKAHLVLGLLWQVIRIGLLSQINLSANPGLALLLEEGESLDDLMKLSPKEILIRWVNYHLRNSESKRQIANFSGDIQDSEAYTYLLNQIAPKDKGVGLCPMMKPDGEERAGAMLCEAHKIDCRVFITSKEVIKGHARLNLAFVANLFNTYPALELPTYMDYDFVEETREEKTYRNWMNSKGVNPHVHNLYADLRDGLVIFQLYEIIKKGVVDWKKVVKNFKKMRETFEKISNCNYAIDLGKYFKFSLPGIAGKDIYDGNQMYTLGLVWQLMRAYTLAILKAMSNDCKPVTDNTIVEWVNNRFKVGGKNYTVKSFHDSSLSDGRTILELIDCIAPGYIKTENVKDGANDDEKMLNAKYAISIGRKIGARIYALPEDIVEVRPKMVMTLFACLMTIVKAQENRAQHNQQQEEC